MVRCKGFPLTSNDSSAAECHFARASNDPSAAEVTSSASQRGRRSKKLLQPGDSVGQQRAAPGQHVHRVAASPSASWRRLEPAECALSVRSLPSYIQGNEMAARWPQRAHNQASKRHHSSDASWNFGLSSSWIDPFLARQTTAPTPLACAQFRCNTQE